MGDLVATAISQIRTIRSAETDAALIVVDALPCAYGDRLLMQQVWTNLIDNAVKYSSKERQPRVTISGREEADRVIYEIADNGAGFDARFSNKLFGVFERLHAESEFPGTGVGLAIVQRIVKRHHGEVWGTSELNHGATFGFSLPRRQPDTAAAAVSDAQLECEPAHSA